MRRGATPEPLLRAALLAAVLVLAMGAPALARDDGAGGSGGSGGGGAGGDTGAGSVTVHWGGHLRLRQFFGRVADDNLLAPVSPDLLTDAAQELRLKLKLGPFGPGDRFDFEIHSETVLREGDTLRATRRLETLFPGALPDLPSGGLFGAPVGDARRLFDLTAVDEGSQYRATERIDRAVLSWHPDWGSVRVGRQALTWGDGLLFNPMDLFNPFSPSDVERDYKLGDDMVSVQMANVAGGELQLLGVPRRDLATGDVAWDQSSLAAKLHHGVPGTGGNVSGDLLAARHYGRTVLGAGASGTVAGGVWRTNVVWTDLDGTDGRDGAPGGTGGRSGFVTAVANLDRSWVLGGRNAYGWIELYCDGLGEADAVRGLEDPALVERLARGELFTLGRRYADASANLEVNPLLNLWITTLRNLDDDSGLVQPRLVWNATQDLEITVGADLSYGGRGSELGGLVVPELARIPSGAWGFPADRTPVLASPDRVYLWVSWYF